ncbi:coiled-coil domain-containing protein 146 [Scleropages formosus]|nr:coiled-coil domain-containing protein 146 [Scleropages formosus]
MSGEMPSPPGEEEEKGQEERPNSALSSRTGSLDEGPAVVSRSRAFQCLDELFSAGKISGAKVAELKGSFHLLQEALRSARDSEARLQKEAERSGSEPRRRRREPERAEVFPEEPPAEVGRMRQQLLKSLNELQEAQERENQLQCQLECLQTEKSVLNMEVEAQRKAAERERKVQVLKDSCEELEEEIAQRRLEIRSLKEDLEEHQRHVQQERRELDNKKEETELKEAELAQLLCVPAQLRKEMERIGRKKAVTEKRRAELEGQRSEAGTLLSRMETQVRALEEQRGEMVQELEGLRTHLEAEERKRDILQREQAMAREKEAAIMAQRAALDVNLSHTASEKKSLQETLGRRLREKDRLLRGLKKMELQLKLASEAQLDVELQYTKAKTQRDALPRGDVALEQRKELEKEVASLKRNLIQQQSAAEGEAEAAEQSLVREQALIRESHQRRQELHHLTCLTQIKADEREQKSRELIKAKQRFSRIEQELRGKRLVIQEHKKQNQEVQARLRVFAKLYDILKAERNKCVSLIQMASQKSAEMQEKSKILENEIEILRTTVINKEKLLQKSRLKHVHSRALRDSLKNDISKMAWLLHEMHDRREEQKLSIGTLTHTINMQEQSLLQMQKRNNSAVQTRNDRGIQLLEREEEMCIFYEKLNVQESLIREGSMEVQAMEQEIHFLNLLVREEKRQIELLCKQLPNKKALEEESTKLQKQLLECRERIPVLAKALEDPAQENRAHELNGQDPSHNELIKKMDQLEARLVQQEVQLLEKELVYEQVTRLSERIQAKTQNRKEESVELAKKMNELQGRIKDTTRKMMAVVSELSMHQACAMTLQREVKDQELHLDCCRRRLEEGLPPSPEMELEWQRILREERRRRTDLQERARRIEEEEKNRLPNGAYTTAEPRPNAYIPQGDNLPLPRPYGALAPFKPSEAGSSMRHIRKPEPKPIEI